MTTEETAAGPTSAYGLSKLAQEEIVRLLAPRHGLEWLILRYGAVQGRGQPFQNAYHGALRIFALRVALERPPVLLEDGNQLRDFVDVSDVARANVMAVESLETGVYNVASGQGHTLIDLARTVLRQANRELPPETPGLYRLGDPRHVLPDVSKLKAAGWEARSGLESMAREYWAWLCEQPGLDSYFEGAEYLMERTGTVRTSR